MSTKIVRTILTLLFLLPFQSRAQEYELRRAVIFPKTGNGVSGYLVEIRVGSEDDTLVLISTKRTEKIPVGELRRVIVLSQDRGGNAFLHGALLGTYAATLLVGRPSGRSTTFLNTTYSSGLGMLLTAFLGVGIGGGIGLMIKTSSSDEDIFDFTGSEVQISAARRKFYDLMSGESDFRRVHFSVQGAHVFSHISGEFRDAIGESNYFYASSSNVSEFNWVRKLQLTYSIQPDLEVGAALSWSGEPPASTSRYSYSSNRSTSLGASQSLDVSGYYAVCRYQPFFGKMPKNTELAVGGGVGLAEINFSRTANIYTYDYNPPYQSTTDRTQTDVNETRGSVLFFGELNLMLRESLSLGLAADYVYFPPKTLPAAANLGLPEQSIRGNGSIGFSLGIHL